MTTPHRPAHRPQVRKGEALGGGSTTADSGPGASGAPPSAAVDERLSRAGTGDPVRTLMRRHAELCARAVDPLEIAAGLEARGMTDRAAARFRHRDVFSLAEELYARVPRAADDLVPPAGQATPDRATVPPVTTRPVAAATAGPPAPARRRPAARLARGTLHLVPGLLCAATVVAFRAAAGGSGLLRGAVGMVGAGLAGLSLWFCLDRGPLRHPAPARRRVAVTAGAISAGWLLGYTLASVPVSEAAPTVIGLAFAVLPAACCARGFAGQTSRSLVSSHSLEEFRGGVRLLLGVTTGLFAGALALLLLAAGRALPGPALGVTSLTTAVCLGTLLFLARLLAVHGFPRAALAGTAVAGGIEAVAAGLGLAARLPGCAGLIRPLARVIAAHGPSTVPAVACMAATLALFGYALCALSRASAHRVEMRW